MWGPRGRDRPRRRVCGGVFVTGVITRLATTETPPERRQRACLPPDARVCSATPLGPWLGTRVSRAAALGLPEAGGLGVGGRRARGASSLQLCACGWCFHVGVTRAYRPLREGQGPGLCFAREHPGSAQRPRLPQRPVRAEEPVSLLARPRERGCPLTASRGPEALCPAFSISVLGWGRRSSLGSSRGNGERCGPSARRASSSRLRLTSSPESQGRRAARCSRAGPARP